MIAIKDKPRRTDLTLMVLTLCLTCLGICLVFDASYAFALQMHISSTKYVLQQGAYGLVGLVLMAYAMYRPYWKWRSLGVYAVALSLLLLGLVFVPHIGIVAKGAHRWVGYGAFRIQPSELAKLAVVLYVARICAGKYKLMSSFWDGPFPPLFVVCLLAFATGIEPDLGTCLVILAIGIGALFFAGMKPKHLLATIAGLMLLGGAFIGFKSLHHGGSGSFQIKRLLVFLHPEKDKQGDGYQVYHSVIALGSGGVLGKGIGEGREKMYLPEAHTDFIFAILGEEGGLVMTLLVLFLYAWLVARCCHVAATTNDPYGALLAGGIATAFGVQVFMNIGVVTASIPATGVPLPFASYGGSSLVISLFMIGIVLNIAKFPDGDPVKAAQSAERVSDREFEMRWNRGQTLSRPEYSRSSGGFGLSPAVNPASQSGSGRPRR